MYNCKMMQNASTRSPIVLTLVGLMILTAGLAGCSVGRQASAIPFVDLQERTPLPAAAPAEVATLRMGVAAILSPQGTMTSYSALAELSVPEIEAPGLAGAATHLCRV